MNLCKNLFPIETVNDIAIKGLNDSGFCHYINEVFINENKNIILLTPTLFEANRLLNILNSYTDKALLFPMDDFLTSMAVAMSPDLEITRLETINNLLNDIKSPTAVLDCWSIWYFGGCLL